VFLVNSRNPRFTATRSSSRSKSSHHRGHTFSRSYGAILPSSLASILSRALGYSPRPPESVCGTDTRVTLHAAFLGSMESASYEPEGSPHHVSELFPRLWLLPPTETSYLLEPARPNGWLAISFSVPACFNVIPDGAGILTCFPSPTPFGLGLGPD
jgi:hypothetical protein